MHAYKRENTYQIHMYIRLGESRYAGTQGQNKKLSSVRDTKKKENYSAKSDAALGRNN